MQNLQNAAESYLIGLDGQLPALAGSLVGSRCITSLLLSLTWSVRGMSITNLPAPRQDHLVSDTAALLRQAHVRLSNDSDPQTPIEPPDPSILPDGMAYFTAFTPWSLADTEAGLSILDILLRTPADALGALDLHFAAFA